MRLSSRAVLLFAGLPMFLMAAKCIENDNLHRTPNGNWAISGEIHNETDIQGTDLVLQGTLLDAAGNEIATASTSGVPGMCPSDLSPGSLSMFTIVFPESASLTEPASYRINVISGKALPEGLPQLELATTGIATRELDLSLTLSITYLLQQAYPDHGQRLLMCFLFYNSAGDALGATHASRDADLSKVGAGDLTVVMDASLVPSGATHLRYWLYIREDDRTSVKSDHQAVVSDLIPITAPIVMPPRP